MSSNKKKAKKNQASNPFSSSPPAAKKKSTERSGDDYPLANYLISCDVPTKQFIQYLNDLKPVDKKFILQDLDSTHLLVKLSAKSEIESKVEDWLDENVFSAIEKVGEDLDMS